jgi:hypothetical protein
MADEVRVTASLQVTKGNLDYLSRPTTYQADVSTANPTGPSPGSIQIATAGTNVSFTQLTTPGYAVLRNLDDTNFVEYGVKTGGTFYELGELTPGTHVVIKFSRNLSDFHMKADTAACECTVEAFEA